MLFPELTFPVLLEVTEGFVCGVHGLSHDLVFSYLHSNISGFTCRWWNWGFILMFQVSKEEKIRACAGLLHLNSFYFVNSVWQCVFINSYISHTWQPFWSWCVLAETQKMVESRSFSHYLMFWRCSGSWKEVKHLLRWKRHEPPHFKHQINGA